MQQINETPSILFHQRNCNGDAFATILPSIYPSRVISSNSSTATITPITVPVSQLRFCVLLNDRHSNTRTYGSRVWNKAKAMERDELLSKGRSSKERAKRVIALFEEEIRKNFPKGEEVKGGRDEKNTMKPIFLRKLDKVEVTSIHQGNVTPMEYFELPNASHYYVKATEGEIHNNIKSFRVRRSAAASPLVVASNIGSNGCVNITKSRSRIVTPTHPQQPNLDARGQKRGFPTMKSDGTVTMTVDQMFTFLTKDIGINKMVASDHIRNKFPQFNASSLSIHPSKRLRSKQKSKSEIPTTVTSTTSPTLFKEIGQMPFSLHRNVTDDEQDEDEYDCDDDTNSTKTSDTSSKLFCIDNEDYWDDMMKNVNLDAQDVAILQSYMADDIKLNDFDDTLCPTLSTSSHNKQKWHPYPYSHKSK